MQTFEQLFIDKKYSEFISDYKDIEDKIEDKDKLTLKPMLALAYFHTEDYSKSAQLFGEMCEIGSDINTWFNYSIATILNGEYAKASDLLNKTLVQYQEMEDKDKQGVIPIPYMLLYASNAFADKEQHNFAFERLHQLASIYIQVDEIELQYLRDRGIPSFEEFANLIPHVLSKQTLTEPIEWLDGLIERINEEGKKELTKIKENFKK